MSNHSGAPEARYKGPLYRGVSTSEDIRHFIPALYLELLGDGKNVGPLT